LRDLGATNDEESPMPTYQYRCTECGTDLEAVQKFSDPALTECPTCHGSLRKVFNAVGVVFKGSGFYRTDSRAKESSSSDGASTASAGETKGKDAAANGSGEKSAEKSAKKGSDTGSGSGNGSKTDGAKAPVKAASGSSTGSSSGS
jgi:putative FmdB family regulatory protein